MDHFQYSRRLTKLCVQLVLILTIALALSFETEFHSVAQANLELNMQYRLVSRSFQYSGHNPSDTRIYSCEPPPPTSISLLYTPLLFTLITSTSSCTSLMQYKLFYGPLLSHNRVSLPFTHICVFFSFILPLPTLHS